jgi:CysZ protein
MMVFRAFALALAQMRDRSFRKVLWLGLALAVALLLAMYAILLMVIQALTPDTLTLPLVGEVGGIGTLLSLGSIVFVLGLSVFLMVPVASAFTGLFLDDVADAVEARHYRALALAPRAPFWASLVDSVQYFGLLLGLNLLGLAVFALSGGLGIVVFWAINGFLLAREYFTLVALRRLSREGAAAMRQRNGFRLWLAGALMAIPLSVPLVNLFVPVLGAAVFTHLFHMLSVREAGKNPDLQPR